MAPDYDPPLPAATVAAAIARAGSNVLHAVMLREVLLDVPPEQRRAERIPDGLRHLFGEVSSNGLRELFPRAPMRRQIPASGICVACALIAIHATGS